MLKQTDNFGDHCVPFQSGLTVVESGRVTELCIAASCEPAMQVRKSDISSVQTLQPGVSPQCK